MKIFWETQCWAGSSIVPSGITCLTWMPHAPKVHAGNPSHITAFHGNQPSDTRGFLAVGTESGVVGVTVTDTADESAFEEHDLSRRYNYNLRGHHSRIQRCAWNATMTKLASCDVNGIIYVWVPNDERWSVELVNDRGLKVRDFNWSPNGTAALILYEDNFVLIGSSNGQRIWSNTFLYQVNCGAWAPTSKELVLGLENGQIQVFTEQGTLITERQLLQVAIQRVAFSPLREDAESKWTLAVVSATDQILFINTFYEVELRSWQSCDPIKLVQWSSCGNMLAVVCKTGNIIILNTEGRPIHSFVPPIQIHEDAISFTWAHDDEAVIVASGGSLAIGRVRAGVPALSELIAYQTWLSLGRTARDVDRLGLPQRSCNIIRRFDRHIIRCRIPSYERMCRFVCEPTFYRWYCTIVPVPKKNFHYMLCLEHLGGLIPILLGRQINRVIPQFVISLPPSTAFSVPGYSRGRFAVQAGEHQVGQSWEYASNGNPNLPIRNSAFTSDLEVAPAPTVDDPAESGFASTVGMEFCSMEEALTLHQGTTAASRNTVWRRSKRRIKKFVSKRLTPRSPKASRMLCQVRSNVWCTRFKITSPGIRDLPHSLAQVVYKTSVLHLQPRQMTISLCDLRPLTKTLPLDAADVQHPTNNNPLLAAARRHRSADSSPAVQRHAHRSSGRNATVEEANERQALATGAEQTVGQGVVSPVDAVQPPLPLLIENPVVQFAPQQRMTYAETRARLRERRPIQRIPVGQGGGAAAGPIAAAQNAAAATGRNNQGNRTRRSALRYFRRQPAEQPPAPPAAPAPNNPEAQRAQQRALELAAGIDEDEEAALIGTAQQVAPPPAERHVRFCETAADNLGAAAATPPTPRNEPEDPMEAELMEEERRLYATVLAEFRGLCAAVGDHVTKMRTLATELELSQSQIAASSSSGPQGMPTTRPRRAPKLGTNRNVEVEDNDTIPSPSTVGCWQNRVDSLDFIDDDNENGGTGEIDHNAFNRTPTEERQLLIPAAAPAAPQRAVPPTANGRKQRATSRMLDHALIDRLATLAADLRLTKRSTKSSRSAEPPASAPLAATSEIEPTDDEADERETADLQPLISAVNGAESGANGQNDSSACPPSVDEMRQQFRHIARQLAQIEEALRPADMFVDLQQRVQRLKSTLGESTHAADLIEPSRGFVHGGRPSTGSQSARSASSAAPLFLDDGELLEVQSERGASPSSLLPPYDTIRMSNKTPFWNEDSQVYQLDFGGRVTQESAKNFQIEHDFEQVMQFGRIENGAYTLDFCSPLSAVQAFGIALASITQRLK
ncbi:Tubby-related protein 4 [Aphelenchoides fujianensis]|nr:Tubby-related protein 4 [Aphelenchoides fujianensis]